MKKTDQNNIKLELNLKKAIEMVSPSNCLNRFWSLKGGIANEMIALEIISANGELKKWVFRKPGLEALKNNPNSVQEEFAILKQLEKASILAPRPVLLDESKQIFSTPYLILEYIEGKPEFDPRNRIAFVKDLASLLSRIHSIDVSTIDLSFLKNQNQLLTKKLKTTPEKLDSTLNEKAIRNCLKSVWPLSTFNKPVLVHGDFWPGNVLWQDEKPQAIIDWEDAALSDPLYELAITRLDCLWILGAEAMDEFTNSYKSRTEINFENLPYWDLVAALRPASKLDKWAADWPALNRPDITEDTMRASHNWFVNQAFEKIARL